MTEKMKELLTAYVDGQLLPTEQAVVHAMVQQSREARQLLHLLQADVDRLRSLSRKRMQSDLSRTLVIPKQASSGSRADVLRHRWRTLRVLQAAAILFLAISAGVAWILVRGMFPNAEKETGSPLNLLAQNVPQEKPAFSAHMDQAARTLLPPQPRLTIDEATGVWQSLRSSMAGWYQTAERRFQAMQQLAMQNWANRPDNGPSERILTSPVLGQGNPFKSLEYRLPNLLKMKDLDRGTTAVVFQPGAIYHIDLAAGETTAVWTLLQTSFRKSSLPLIWDQELNLRQHRQLTGSLLIYAENLAPEQAARLLQAIAREANTLTHQTIESILIQTLDDKGMKWLAATLGITPQSLVPHDTAQRKLVGIDLTKPLSDETLKALLKLSAGQGRGQPAPTVALALSASTPRLVPVSKELRAGMEQRRGLQPENLSLVIFVRARMK